MAQVGKPLDPWQQLMVMDTFGLRPDGYWAAFECVGLVPRQNGKGGYTEAVELAGLFLFGDQVIMHSAHLFKTAKQSFQRLIDIIENSDWLRKRVAKVVRARGDEEIQLTPRAGGGRLLCFSRHGGAGRGFTGDKTVFDECAYLTIEQYQAATPTLATVPNPQIIYTGTPPDEDVGPMPDDAMMPSVRRRGHEGGDRIALWEWSPPDEYDRNDPDVWAACNPALGVRIQPWFLAKQLANFTAAGKPEKFDTEHLGVWPSDAGARWQVITEQDWLDLLDDASTAKDPLVFAVDVTPERTFSSIAAVGTREDGDLHGEVVDHAQGTSWLVERVVELNTRWKPAAWVIDPGGAAGFLIPPLEEAGAPVVKLSSRNVSQAYGLFRSAAASAERAEAPETEPTLTGSPLEDDVDAVKVPRLHVRPGRHAGALSAAVEGATTRRVGDGTTWDRKNNTVVISPLVALTNALYGFMTREVEDERPFFAAWR